VGVSGFAALRGQGVGGRGELSPCASRDQGYNHHRRRIIRPPETATEASIVMWIRLAQLLLFGGLAVSTGQAASHTNLAHYRFDNNGPAITNDVSGQANHFTGISSWGAPLHAFDTNAQVGPDAIRFYGNSSLTLAPPHAAFDHLTAALADSFSLSLWLRTTVTQGNDIDDAVAGAGVVWNYDSGTNDIIPLAVTGNLVAFHTGDEFGISQTLHATNVVTDGQYHHLVVTRDRASGEKRIYVDGQFQAEEFGTTNLLNANNYLLSLGGVASNGFNGWLDDVQFYAGTLNSNEVSFLYYNPGSVVPDATNNVFDPALNTLNLPWHTGGDVGWFVQSALTHDGVTAAQSGAIGDDTDSYLETTVLGPGTLTFWWKVSCEEDFDYLEFRIDGDFKDQITGEAGWLPASYTVGPGPHLLRWHYAKDIIGSEGADAGFLDEVRFFTPVDFSLRLVREQHPAFDPLLPDQVAYRAFPGLTAPDAAVSQHRVESPTGLCYGLFDGTNASGFSLAAVGTFGELAQALTNGNWKLWLNKDTPQQHFYTFTLQATTFASNHLAAFAIFSPANGSTSVASNPSFAWEGLTNWDTLSVSAWQTRYGTNYYYASENLPVVETTWNTVPPLAEGTNVFSLTYRRNGMETNFAISTPCPGWAVTNISYETTVHSGFIVFTPATPVQLVNPTVTPGGLQFEFLSEAGRTNLVQSRTNLTVGDWVTRTNLIGDGLMLTVQLPLGDVPMEFFRVCTQ
jgi:hypothetical protein